MINVAKEFYDLNRDNYGVLFCILTFFLDKLSLSGGAYAVPPRKPRLQILLEY